MRVFEAYANRNTKCSCCEKKIWKNDVIALCYENSSLLWLKCCDCYLKNTEVK